MTMAILRFIIFMLTIAPFLTAVVVISLDPQTLDQARSMNASLALSLIGAGLSYFGLLFSLYAALEVRNISQKYFFKLRSPEIHKRLLNITKRVSLFSNEPRDDLRSQTFISEIPVVLRAAKRVKNSEVKSVAKEAEKLFKKLKETSEVSLQGDSAGQIQGYWDLFQKLSELADEVKTQIEDVRATQ